jgi:preprotein translocase subunit SecF
MTELRTCTDKKPIPFMKIKWLFILASLFFIAMSGYEIIYNGLNFGVDFLGGTKLIYKFDASANIKEIRTAVNELKIGDVQVIKFGNNPSQNQFMMRAKYVKDVDVAKLVHDQLVKAFGADKITQLSEEVVGPKVGQDLQKKGMLSILFTCALILIYIGFRFDFLFSPGAIFALMHDVIISVGFFAYFGKEFNLPILAALLTIIGYSINDTIVIYDRIRENIKKFPKNTPASDVINVSITETIRRTLVTSLTSLLVVTTLFVLGGGVLHDFAFCLIVGISFGTYSSIFIASPIYILLHRLFPKHGIKIVEDDDAQAA